MGTDYNFDFKVGFVISSDDLKAIFGEKVPEVSHMEDRFDTTTGKKTKPVKVIDEPASMAFKFLGEIIEEDDGTELADAIAGHLRCTYDYSRDHHDDGDDVFYFGPRMPKGVESDSMEWDHISIPRSLPFDVVAKMGPELKRIKKGLVKLGLEPGEAAIHITYSVG